MPAPAGMKQKALPRLQLRGHGTEMSDREQRPRRNLRQLDNPRRAHASRQGCLLNRCWTSREMNRRVHVRARVRVDVPRCGVPAVTLNDVLRLHRDATRPGPERQSQVYDARHGMDESRLAMMHAVISA